MTRRGGEGERLADERVPLLLLLRRSPQEAHRAVLDSSQPQAQVKPRSGEAEEGQLYSVCIRALIRLQSL